MYFNFSITKENMKKGVFIYLVIFNVNKSELIFSFYLLEMCHTVRENSKQ